MSLRLCYNYRHVDRSYNRCGSTVAGRGCPSFCVASIGTSIENADMVEEDPPSLDEEVPLCIVFMDISQKVEAIIEEDPFPTREMEQFF